MRRVVEIGQVEHLFHRVCLEHGYRVLGAADEQHVLVRDGDLRGERLGGERVHLLARSVVYGDPLVLLVARVQVAVGGLGGRGTHQLGDGVGKFLEAVALVREYVEAAVTRVSQEVRTRGKK